MLKKTITYVDFDDNEITEDFYFNISKAEMIEMELEITGGLSEKLKQIIDSKDNKQIIDVFKEIIFKAYGVKSSDGKRFIKSDALSEEFSQTEAYNVLFMELFTNENAASSFVNGIFPKDMREKLNK